MIDDLNDHARLVDRLSASGAPDFAAGGIRVIATHISSVLLTDGEAFKIKKPVDFGFLDFSTLEKRRRACEDEVRLNGRLAPDIYLGVVPVTGSLDQPVLGGEGEPLEYAVHMRQFAADALLADHPDLLTVPRVDDIARQVASFQERIARAPGDGEFGQPEAVYFPMAQNFQQLRERVTDADDLERLSALERWTRDRYEELKPLLQQRVVDGFVREGHGDMHLGNIALDGERLIIFDGIEFNPNLRWIDVINEIAFLMMDLDRIGRQDLGRRFLNTWLAETGDFEGLHLLRFYQVYRAMVRTKIAAIRLGQELDERERAAVTAAYREYLSLAETYLSHPKPQLIITYGPSGCGKSVAAARLAETRPAIQIRSDVERKRLAGLGALERSGSALDAGLYTPEMGRKTYERLLELSRIVIEAGFAAIADATFLKRDQRAPFRALAGELGVDLRILAPEADEAELRRRVTERLAGGADPAEADIAVLEKQLATLDPLTPEEAADVLIPPNP